MQHEGTDRIPVALDEVPVGTGVPVATGLTYDDLAAMPEPAVDGLRKELIDGELYVSPAPIIRHQRVVAAVSIALGQHAKEHGGLLLFAPTDVHFSRTTIVEPDVLFLTAQSEASLGDHRYIDVVPDLLVEVSSPSTRRLDLIRKRRLYEREGVVEHWFVDLEADRIDVYRLGDDGHYGDPVTLEPGDTLTCVAAPRFAMEVDEALAS